MQNGSYDNCGIPLDAEQFDVSGFLSEHQLPQKGERAVLASFDVHPQYCGVLECFVQFTDLYACDNTMVETSGLEWIIFRNGQPLFPYNKIESILNPWGYAYHMFHIRLDENSNVEFTVFNRNFNDFLFSPDDKPNEKSIGKVGGRIMGRYWYNKIYGNLQR